MSSLSDSVRTKHRSFVRGAVTLALPAVLLLIPHRSQADDHCATEPPPQGLVERCRSLTFSFSDGTSDGLRRAVLNVALLEWMSGCVVADRAPALIGEAEESVDKVFALVKDMAPQRGVRIIPDYTPLTFTQDGQTCYGVKSVSFHVAGAQGTVDADGDIEIIPGPSSEMIKDAATAARKALQDPAVPGSGRLSRFLSVLVALESSGKDFDDTWYNVAPDPSGDPMNTPPACFTDFQVGKGYVCRPADEALHTCERHLAGELVDVYNDGKVPLDRFRTYLQGRAEDIQRGVDYVSQVHGVEGAEAAACSSVSTVFAPRMATASGRNSVYGAGQY